MRLPQDRILHIGAELKDGKVNIVAEWQGELVRCKDCKKAKTEDCSHSYWDDDWGVFRIGYNGDDWYCADGERKSGDTE